jgi:endonuclease YncB( thermonuclease family)
MRAVLPLALLLAVLASPAGAHDEGSANPNCAATQGQLPKTWEGKAFAVDGNTLVGIGFKPRIRLWGIQAPELRIRLTGQENPAGMRSRAALEDLLTAGDRQLSCKVIKWDRSCRAVAQCTITAEMPAGAKPQPHDIALRLLEDGLAYGADLGDAISEDPTTSERYAHYEALARKAGKGLWPTWLGTDPP